MLGAFVNPLYWFFCAARERVKRFSTVFLRANFFAHKVSEVREQLPLYFPSNFLKNLTDFRAILRAIPYFRVAALIP